MQAGKRRVVSLTSACGSCQPAHPCPFTVSTVSYGFHSRRWNAPRIVPHNRPLHRRWGRAAVSGRCNIAACWRLGQSSVLLPSRQDCTKPERHRACVYVFRTGWGYLAKHLSRGHYRYTQSCASRTRGAVEQAARVQACSCRAGSWPAGSCFTRLAPRPAPAGGRAAPAPPPATGSSRGPRLGAGGGGEGGQAGGSVSCTCGTMRSRHPGGQPELDSSTNNHSCQFTALLSEPACCFTATPGPALATHASHSARRAAPAAATSL